MHLTRKRLVELIKDEHMAHREYMKLGFTKLAADERTHAKFLEKLLKEEYLPNRIMRGE